MLITKADQALLEALCVRLEDWAQNEEMINSSFTKHGEDCLSAVDFLIEYNNKCRETIYDE